MNVAEAAVGRLQTRARFQGTTAVPSAADIPGPKLAARLREPGHAQLTVSFDPKRLLELQVMRSLIPLVSALSIWDSVPAIC